MQFSALSNTMREILPFHSLLSETLQTVGLPNQKATKIRCKIMEDNRGDLTLANLEEGRVTPNSKHFAVKYHWF